MCMTSFDLHDKQLDTFALNSENLLASALKDRKSKEVSWRTLTSEDRELFMEAKARELSEHLRVESCRRASAYSDYSHGMETPEDHFIRMRLLLTWKAMSPGAPASKGKTRQEDLIDGYTTVNKDGTAKAKARIILPGFNHPELNVGDHHGAKVLNTASPTISYRGKMRFCQLCAFRRWTF